MKSALLTLSPEMETSLTVDVTRTQEERKFGLTLIGK